MSDPGHGVSALESPQRTANLLQDLLSDAPRETGLLVAAASAGLPAALRGHAAQGMDPATAIRLAAASLAGRTAFAPEACEWAATELAIAAGLVSTDQFPVTSPPAGPAERARPPAEAAPPQAGRTDDITPREPGPDRAPRPARKRPARATAGGRQ